MSVLKLDGVVDWQWKYIFIPLYILLFQIIFIPLSYEYSKFKTNYSFEDELDPEENHYCGPIFFLLAFAVPLAEKNGRYSLFPILIGFSCFLILAILQISGVISILWSDIFIPLYFVCFWVIGIIFFVGDYNVFTDSRRFDRIILSIGVLLLFLFFLFLSFKLDNKIYWSWYAVMIPLFIIKALIVIIPIILSLLSICCELWFLEDFSRFGINVKTFCFSIITITILILAPLLSFEITLANHLETNNHTSYSLIFIPIFILEGFGLCGCCLANCAFLCT